MQKRRLEGMTIPANIKDIKRFSSAKTDFGNGFISSIKRFKRSLFCKHKWRAIDSFRFDESYIELGCIKCGIRRSDKFLLLINKVFNT